MAVLLLMMVKNGVCSFGTLAINTPANMRSSTEKNQCNHFRLRIEVERLFGKKVNMARMTCGSFGVRKIKMLQELI